MPVPSRLNARILGAAVFFFIHTAQWMESVRTSRPEVQDFAGREIDFLTGSYPAIGYMGDLNVRAARKMLSIMFLG
jgi:hypothetical protein